LERAAWTPALSLSKGLRPCGNRHAVVGGNEDTVGQYASFLIECCFCSKYLISSSTLPDNKPSDEVGTDFNV
jgi:hypothetical protein